MSTSFYSFCGNSSFWNESYYENSDWPQMTPCFVNTAVVWIPCGWLCLSLPVYIYFLYFNGNRTQKISVNAISVMKLLVCIYLCVLSALFLIRELTKGAADDKTTSIKILNNCIYMTSFLVAAILTQIERIKGRVTSPVLFVFFLLLMLTNIVPFYTKIFLEIYNDDLFDFVTFYIFYFFVIVQFVLQCWAERKDLSTMTEDEKTMCPEMEASILNRMYYWWMNSIVVNAYRKPLEEKDVWSLGISEKSTAVVPRLEKNWKKEMAKGRKKFKRVSESISQRNSLSFKKGEDNCEKTPLLSSAMTLSTGESKKGRHQNVANKKGRIQYKPSLLFVLTKTFVLDYATSLFFKFLSDVIQFSSPLLLGVLMNYADKRPELPTWRGYVPAIVLFLCTVIQSVFYHQNYHTGMTTGMRIKTSLMAAIFRKSLTLHHSAKKSTTLGEIVNLMSIDCQRIQDTFAYTWSLMSCPLQLGIGIVILWGVIGPSCLAGLFVLLILVLASSFIIVLQKKLQEKVLRWKGKRIKLMNEILQGIKVLKMYAWEPYFEEKVTEIRNKELHLLRLHAYLQGLTTLLWRMAPFLNTLSTFSVYVLTSDEHFVDANKAFITVAVFNIVGSPINSLSTAFSLMAMAYVSIGRIETFLTCQDLDTGNVERNSNSDNAVEIKDGIFSWDLSMPAPTLKGINLKVDQGKLIAIVGQVGCGKSSLISALLGEMDKLNGKVNIRGDVAYVPQEAWIQNDTLRNNILFGNEFLQKKYKKTIDACALRPDLEILPGGDLIEIGEKGINISGGQKQRVSLARAVYSNSDIYLMDDPLSAVDAHVGKHIFENVIGPKGLLNKKTRILVTHGVHWLPMVDTVVVMVNGKISEMGSYEELVSHDGAFAQFLKQYLMQEEGSDIEDPPEIQKVKQKIIEQVESITSDSITSTDTEGRMIQNAGRKRNNSGTYKSLAHIEQEEKKRLSEKTRLTTDELSPENKIKWSAFGYYFKALGILANALVCMAFAGFVTSYILSSFMLAYWTEDDYLKSNKNLSTTEEYMDRSYAYLTVYGSLGIIQAVMVFIYSILLSVRMVVASKKLHYRMLQSVMQAPMAFFDTTPIGRITNRFSSDVDIIDGIIQMMFRIAYVTTFFVISILIVITINTPVLLTIILPVAVLYYIIMKFYIPSAWQLKQMESATRSPVYNHFSETVSGTSVIRAFGATDRFIEESMRRVDKHQVYYYANFSSARWVGIRVEFLGNLLVFSTAMFSVFSDLDSATVGLSVTYALQMTYFLNLLIVSYSDLTNNIVCVDRIKDYSEVEAEAAWYSMTKPREDWPATGNIQFIGYETRYRKGLDLVLKGINFEINHGEMIGIVGRTGAGKSSLTLSLFRLIEAAGGAIIIDGVKIADIGLHDLRSNITILPQDPVLFSGSLRMNLDPFDRYTDDEIWQALESAHLKEFVLMLPTQLDYECGEGGSNLSVGQRQLVCLGRTLLKKTKILILDEATAAVDFQTDDLIQETIRKEFRDCTVLTIAHRLNTILDYDRVMVLDEGKVIEFDSPAVLLQDLSSVFYGMAKNAGLTVD